MTQKEIESRAAGWPPIREVQSVPFDSDLLSWDFDVLSLSAPRAAQKAHQLLCKFAREGGALVDAEAIRNYVLVLQANYNAVNPYHNFWRALGVARTLGNWLRAPDLQDYLDPSANFALVSAAMAVDVDHPGVSNRYLSQ